MIRYISGRFLWGIATLWGITLVIFIVIHLSGDPTALYVGQEGTKQDYEVMRAALGFDQPLPVQYGRFLLGAIHGDFGRSLRFRQPAISLALGQFPATVKLALVSMLLAVCVAVPLGIVASIRHNSLLDTAALVFALWGQCMPTFWLGTLLILIFAANLRLVPVIGGEGPIRLILPAVTLGAWAMARTARFTRSSMLEVLRQDFLRTAHAKGLDEWSVVLRHALRNAAIPIITALGLDFGTTPKDAMTVSDGLTFGKICRQTILNDGIPSARAAST